MGVHKIENICEMIQGQAGIGFMIGLDEFEALEYSEIVENIEYDQYGRYLVTDVYGETGYFYPAEIAA